MRNGLVLRYNVNAGLKLGLTLGRLLLEVGTYEWTFSIRPNKMDSPGGPVSHNSYPRLQGVMQFIAIPVLWELFKFAKLFVPYRERTQLGLQHPVGCRTDFVDNL